MTTESDAASTADTQASAPAEKPELKSTDTSVLKALKTDTATPSPKAEQPEEKKPATPNASQAAKGQDADSSEAAHQDEERKLEPWMRKRLSRAEEKGRKQAREEVLAEIRSQRPPEQSQQGDKGGVDTPKTLADFDYDVEKFTQHQVREGVKAALSERDAESQRLAAERKAEEARNAFEKRKAEFEKRVGEGSWDEMVSAKVDVPQEVIDLLVGHDRDLDIAHYLIHNPEELDGLRGKNKLQIARGLTAIEEKLSGSTERELPPKTTKTPPPPPRVTGAGKSVKSIAEMSTAERIAEWRRQKQRQAS
jgi:hypothetical protein